MFAKIVAIIVALGVVGCALLALRQSRLQAASELAQAQLRMQEHDARLWKLRARIAARVSPAEVERLAAALGPMAPMIAVGPEDGLEESRPIAAGGASGGPR